MIFQRAFDAGDRVDEPARLRGAEHRRCRRGWRRSACGTSGSRARSRRAAGRSGRRGGPAGRAIGVHSNIAWRARAASVDASRSVGVAIVVELLAGPPVVVGLVIVPLREDRDLGRERADVVVLEVVGEPRAEVVERLGDPRDPLVGDVASRRGRRRAWPRRGSGCRRRSDRPSAGRTPGLGVADRRVAAQAAPLGVAAEALAARVAGPREPERRRRAACANRPVDPGARAARGLALEPHAVERSSARRAARRARRSRRDRVAGPTTGPATRRGCANRLAWCPTRRPCARARRSAPTPAPGRSGRRRLWTPCVSRGVRGPARSRCGRQASAPVESAPIEKPPAGQHGATTYRNRSHLL